MAISHYRTNLRWVLAAPTREAEVLSIFSKTWCTKELPLLLPASLGARGYLYLPGFLPSVGSAFLRLLALRASAAWRFLTARIHGHGAFIIALGGFLCGCLENILPRLKIKFSIGIKTNPNPRYLWCMPGWVSRGFEQLEHRAVVQSGSLQWLSASSVPGLLGDSGERGVLVLAKRRGRASTGGSWVTSFLSLRMGLRVMQPSWAGHAPRLGSVCLGLNAGSARHHLCDLEQAV